MQSNLSLGAWIAHPFRADPRFRRLSLVFLLLSTAIRLFLVTHTEWVSTADTRDYHEFARSLLAGRGYMQVYEGETDAYNGLTFYAYRMPGYPLMLAAVYKVFGWVPQAAMMLNVIAELVTQLCLAVLGWHLLGAGASIFAQAVWMLHPFHVADLITESISICVFVVLATLLAHGGPLRTRREALLYGLTSICAIFVRPINVVSYLMLGVKMLFDRLPFRRILALGLVAFLPTALGLGAWTYRNYLKLGHPLLLTSQGGRVNAKDYGLSFERVVQKERGRGVTNEAELSKALKIRVTHRMSEEPSRVAEIYLRRLGQLVALTDKDLRALHFNVLFQNEKSPPWLWFMMYRLYFQYHLVYVLAALAPLLCWRERARWRDLAIPVLCFLLFHAGVTKGNVRYAATIFPHLALLAGASVGWAYARLAARFGIRAAPAPGAPGG